ncbi:hypothetical protein BT69DRAFT_1327870 [Atractiella rhizophila]|nr:hypothetical protein BT69DRAFT_1327870 [Atractiella rhizophila]
MDRRTLGQDPPIPTHTDLKDPNRRVKLFRPEPKELLIVLPSSSRCSVLELIINSHCLQSLSKQLWRVSNGPEWTCNPDSVITLEGSAYLYLVDGKKRKYPVITDFRAWTPPEEPPGHWTRNKPSCQYCGFQYVRHGNGFTQKMPHFFMVLVLFLQLVLRLMMVGSSVCFCLQNAHLVPTDEVEWFQFHLQRQHNIKGPALTEDVSNGLAMRADIHISFDAYEFVLAPYGGKIVPYFLTWEESYVSQYHLRPIALPSGISVHHLYSRFAFNVINNARIPAQTANRVTVPQNLAVKARKPKGSKERDQGTSHSSLPSIVDGWEDTRRRNMNFETLKRQTLCQRWFEMHPEIRIVAGVAVQEEDEEGEPSEEEEQIQDEEGGSSEKEQAQEQKGTVDNSKQQEGREKTTELTSDAGFSQDFRKEDASEYRVKRWRSRVHR